MYSNIYISDVIYILGKYLPDIMYKYSWSIYVLPSIIYKYREECQRYNSVTINSVTAMVSPEVSTYIIMLYSVAYQDQYLKLESTTANSSAKK